MMQLQHARKDKNPLATFTDLEAELQTIQSELTALGVMLGPQEKSYYDSLAEDAPPDDENTRTHEERDRKPKDKHVKLPIIREEGKKDHDNPDDDIYLKYADGDYMLDQDGEKILKEQRVKIVRYPPDIEDKVHAAWVMRYNHYFRFVTGVESDFQFRMTDFYEMSPLEACFWRDQFLLGFLSEQPFIVVACSGPASDTITARYRLNPIAMHLIDNRPWQDEKLREASFQETTHNCNEIERACAVASKMPIDKRIHLHQTTCENFFMKYLEAKKRINALFSDPGWGDYEDKDVEQDLKDSVGWTLKNVYIPMTHRKQHTDILCVKSRFPGERYRREWDRQVDEWKKNNPDIPMVEMKYFDSVMVNPYKKLSEKHDKNGDSELKRVGLGHGVKGVFYWIFFSAYNARIRVVENSNLWDQVVVHGKPGIAHATTIPCGDIALTYPHTWSTNYLTVMNNAVNGPNSCSSTELPWELNRDFVERDNRRKRLFKEQGEYANERNTPAQYDEANALYEADKRKRTDGEGYDIAGPKGKHHGRVAAR